MTNPGGGILSIGECMVELSPEGGDRFVMGFAGDSFNSAWYLRRLLPRGRRVAYATCIGEDAVSERMADFMQGAGIDTAAVRRVTGRTVGLYLIEVVDGERSFSYWRGQSAARLLGEDAEWLAAVLTGPEVLLFSGITLAILPPEGRARLLAALGEARAAGATVAFDSNLRPGLWEDRAVMHRTTAAAAGVADIALPSFDDDAALFGDATPQDTVARYAGAGARLVAVKNATGPLHAWSREAGTEVFTPTPAARVVDTTAAGDSFNAGLLAALMEGASPGAAVGRAMAVSAEVVTARGALVAPSAAVAGHARA